MSAYWEGNLRNSVADVCIDTALLVLTVYAYVPQISLLRQDITPRGISPFFVLFDVIVGNAQLSENVLCAAFAWPTAARPVIKEIGNGSLKDREAYGAVLGLLQIFVQWSCSVIVLMSFALAGGRYGRGILIVAFFHAALVLFPAVKFSLPHPSGDRNMGRGIIMALIGMADLLVAPCCAYLQFFAQWWEMNAQNGAPGALSLLSIALQVLTMVALGIRWFLRLGHPPWGYRPLWGYRSAPLYIWYQWGFTAINYLLHAVGCAFLLACYLYAARGRVEHGNS